jgi:hypothetical protein
MIIYDKAEEGRNLATFKGRSTNFVINASDIVDEQM